MPTRASDAKAEGKLKIKSGPLTSSVFVSGVDVDMQRGEIWKQLERWGRVNDVRCPKDKEGKRKSFIFVEFAKLTDASSLIESSGNILLGRTKAYAEAAHTHPTTPCLTIRATGRLVIRSASTLSPSM